MSFVLVSACATEPEPVPAPAGPPVIAIAHGGDRFVRLSYDSPRFDVRAPIVIATSDDGEHWEPRTELAEFLPPSAGIAFADGVFLVVASDFDPATAHAIALRSTDGIEWQRVADPPLDTGAVAGGGGTFVAVSGDHGIVTTTDGSAWSAPAAGTAELWYEPEVVRAGDRYVAYGEGRAMLESFDGTTWTAFDTELTSIESVGTIDGTSGGGAIVGFGTYDCCFGEVPDGITHVELRRAEAAWNVRALEAQPSWSDFVDVGGRTIAVTIDRIATSTDGGVTWSEERRDLGFGPRIASDGTNVVIATNRGILVSHDGGVQFGEPGSL
ncbi:MAG TPA: hypothetical protein VFQ53_42520 [Kofleriaceae bacterium]|nr:hypothetical protein [Kofleriaceae bacterium]